MARRGRKAGTILTRVAPHEVPNADLFSSFLAPAAGTKIAGKPWKEMTAEEQESAYKTFKEGVLERIEEGIDSLTRRKDPKTPTWIKGEKRIRVRFVYRRWKPFSVTKGDKVNNLGFQTTPQGLIPFLESFRKAVQDDVFKDSKRPNNIIKHLSAGISTHG